MDINLTKVEIIKEILFINDEEMIREIDRFIRSLDHSVEDRYYTRKRFNEDGTPVDKQEKKPGAINEAKRKIKGMFKLYQ